MSSAFRKTLEQKHRESAKAIESHIIRPIEESSGEYVGSATGGKMSSGLKALGPALAAIWWSRNVQAAVESQHNEVRTRSLGRFANALRVDPGDLAGVDVFDDWLKSQEDLLKNGVPEEYIARLKRVGEAMGEGRHKVETMVSNLREAYHFGEGMATNIAEDTTTQLGARYTQEGSLELGIEEYSWSSSRDQRTRKHHLALDMSGKYYKWSDPPVGGGNGPTDRGNPGDARYCRCEAIPKAESLKVFVGRGRGRGR